MTANLRRRITELEKVVNPETTVLVLSEYGMGAKDPTGRGEPSGMIDANG